MVDSGGCGWCTYCGMSEKYWRVCRVQVTKYGGSASAAIPGVRAYVPWLLRKYSEKRDQMGVVIRGSGDGQGIRRGAGVRPGNVGG